MAISLFGDATGDGIQGAGGGGLHFAPDGSIALNLVSGKSYQILDHSGNLLCYQDENSRLSNTVKVPLAAVDTGGGVLSWQNPLAVTIMITKILVDVTTHATGACTVDVGTTATSATTQSDNLADGVDVGTAAGTFSTSDQAGANGRTQQKLAAGKWLTISKDSGASAGLVGFAYITYHPI